MQFNPDGWFNATLAAERFGKSPYEWQRLPETVRYMQALEIRYGKIPYVKTSRARADRGGGTWLHPKLAVRFAQWLDVDFAIWCDEQVDALIRGTGDGWEAVRAGAAHQHSALCDMVRLTRQAIGKTTQPHHYANEARLINLALTGSASPVNRNSLSKPELRLLELIERQDMVLMGMGQPYEQRKTGLLAFAAAERQRLPALRPPMKNA
ncbi:KilA-N domain-containing protein [Laribacter hongkongensis]|nr:KilA-N domain-containing protein [Laribacter hongkongensis]MCG8991735.1 KilA-N domain-containing protein [Laribacter hongkongensis]MCG8998928.1 KilA-N domain-containing protein [Laribacter hongkongensis]MCG9000287.1 KilA-N domain-containing protein [Laribacter hongkongensis]MCG9012464.1 KilA-N domain-containing protein [Laribacter hongkongensis]MCG9018342.1 KilA-N domain-containing protein [Laribacter hongkongensis]